MEWNPDMASSLPSTAGQAEYDSRVQDWRERCFLSSGVARTRVDRCPKAPNYIPTGKEGVFTGATASAITSFVPSMRNKASQSPTGNEKASSELSVEPAVIGLLSATYLDDI